MVCIYRGDDTNFKDFTTISLTLDDVPYSITGCSADFTLCGQTVVINEFSMGEPIAIKFSAEQTSKMKLGVQCGAFRIIDPSGRVRTINATIRVKVTDDPAEAYGGEDSIVIKNRIPWGSIGDLPLVGSEFDLTDVNGITAAVGALIESLGGTVHA